MITRRVASRPHISGECFRSSDCRADMQSSLTAAKWTPHIKGDYDPLAIDNEGCIWHSLKAVRTWIIEAD